METDKQITEFLGSVVMPKMDLIKMQNRITAAIEQCEEALYQLQQLRDEMQRTEPPHIPTEIHIPF